MSCSSIVALPRSCGSEGVMGGLEKLYIISYDDLAAISGTTSVYAVSTTGIINNIGLQTGKKFVEVGLLKSTAGLNETLTKDLSKGTAFFKQALSLVLSNLTLENRAFVDSVVMQPVAVLIKTRTGKFFASGLNGQLELATATTGTGVKEDDSIGFTLQFDGIDTHMIRLVDDTIVGGLHA